MLQPLSAVLITRNSAAVLPACLKSLRFADEIVIVDSGSTDTTLDIARHFNAKIVHQEWLGYGKQKQFAVAQAAHDWVLCVDTDERVSEPLRESILRELQAPRFHAYQMPRRNRFLGRWLKHGEGYPDLSLRLFDRRHANWSDDPIHEKVVTAGPVGRLAGDLLHESEQGLADYLAKQDRYTTLQAEALHARGKRASIARQLLSPPLRFIKFYFFRLGFLDGIPGLMHILVGCRNSFTKYAKLRALRRRDRH
ncbi:MAG: glycosyltransferase family 2 protein [Gammaproteobacteria bacterium]|nr:MAG: glycosyltransferase family 2 protein [Gammaproteobacteria bacterium]